MEVTVNVSDEFFLILKMKDPDTNITEFLQEAVNLMEKNIFALENPVMKERREDFIENIKNLQNDLESIQK